MYDTDDITLSGGFKVYFQPGYSGGFVDLGNIIDPELVLENEPLEHFNSRSGVKVKDKEAVLQAAAGFTFGFDTLNEHTLRYFLASDAAASVSATSTQIVTEMVKLSGVVPQTLGFPVHGTPGHVVKDVTEATTYTLDTDYSVSGNTITRISDGSIADGQEVLVTYNWDAPALHTLNPMVGNFIEGAARIIVRPSTGRALYWSMAKSLLKPDGNLSFSDGAWAQGQFRLDALDNSGSVSGSPFGVVRTWQMTAESS